MALRSGRPGHLLHRPAIHQVHASVLRLCQPPVGDDRSRSRRRRRRRRLCGLSGRPHLLYARRDSSVDDLMLVDDSSESVRIRVLRSGINDQDKGCQPRSSRYPDLAVWFRFQMTDRRRDSALRLPFPRTSASERERTPERFADPSSRQDLSRAACWSQLVSLLTRVLRVSHQGATRTLATAELEPDSIQAVNP